MKTVYKSKWILPKDKEVIENGALLVDNGKILSVLKEQDLENINLSEYKLVDFENALITPGFINLHTHLQYTQIGKKKSKKLQNRITRLYLILRKYLICGGQQKSFVSWIIDLLIEYVSWDKKEKQDSFKDGLNKILLSGTTSVAQLSTEEMYFEILNASPVKSYIFFEIYGDSPESSEENFEKFREMYLRLSEKSSTNVFLGVSPHSVYNVHKTLWEKISEFSIHNNVLIHTHFAESTEEINWIKTGVSEISKLHKFVGFKSFVPEQNQRDPVLYLKNLMLPYENLILAHNNQLNDHELTELAELQVNIAHCPRSNLILHNKTVDASQLIRLFPSRAGLGTDSLYSNHDLNILNEAKFVFDSGVDIFAVLEMLTINPAKILRIDHLTGSLEQGKDADFLVFNLCENESYTDFINKVTPDHSYISGVQVVKNKQLI